ncbi:MAG: TIGR00725 family protein [Limnothrix sp. RL_2_0]|nr:TIGR00725 family protein [Limnothrix sp. RL_2_0]
MRKKVIGVMGAGAGATPENIADAYELGQAIAANDWILLTGGRAAGVMEAASRGAKAANGLTLGILPNQDTQDISEFVDIAIYTDMGNARNNINVLSSDVIIAVGMGMGTASEMALAVKNNTPAILLKPDPETFVFFTKFAAPQVQNVMTIDAAIALTKTLLT